jgi:hypothetical protein
MKILKLAGLVLYLSAGSNAAALSSPQLAIYYSFDAALPPAALFTEMQSELTRILAPSGLRVAWRATDSPRNNGDDFPGLVMIRFHGTCFFDAAPLRDESADPSGLPLAQTQITDGRILPFATVNCDQVRRFIAPAEQFPDPERKNGSFGRALARVIAHEIYHMLSKSPSHASQGIERSRHSRADLTAPDFGFAPTETNWLQSWVSQVQRELPVQSAGLTSTSQPTDTDDAVSAGR